MTLKTQLRTAAERNQAKSAERVDKYFSTMSSLVAKLPGERLTSYAVKALDGQQEATHRMLNRQAKVQNWLLRDRAAAKATDN